MDAGGGGWLPGWLGVDDHVMFSFSLSYPPWNTSFLSIFILSFHISSSYVNFPTGTWIVFMWIFFFARFSGYFPQHPISIIPHLFSHTHREHNERKIWLTNTSAECVLHRFSPPSQNVSLCAEREMKSSQGYHGEILKIDN